MNVASTIQDCRNHLSRFKTSIALTNSQRTEINLQATLQAWQTMQSAIGSHLIPDLNTQLEMVEAQNLNLQRETQLRSLNPEVTRLIKLLQIDWQFWQAAKAPDRQVQRQQQLLGHLEQLDQLLGAIEAMGLLER